MHHKLGETYDRSCRRGYLGNLATNSINASMPGELLVDYIRVYDSSATTPLPLCVATVSSSGPIVVFSGSNGIPNATYYLLSSTNIFTSTGSFTNTVSVSSPARFYILQVP